MESRGVPVESRGVPVEPSKVDRLRERSLLSFRFGGDIRLASHNDEMYAL